MCIVLGETGDWPKIPLDEIKPEDRQPSASYLPWVVAGKVVERYK